MKCFDSKPFIDAANILVTADEVERALQLLNNLPAWYRDNPPYEITVLKNEILHRICTPKDYVKIDAGSESIDWSDQDKMSQTLRGSMLLKDVREFNIQGLIPHIIDYAPGPFWVAVVLQRAGCKFTYQPVCLRQESVEFAKQELSLFVADPLPSQPQIFLAYEIIEHLWSETEVKTASLINRKLPDIVHVSTPRYSFDTETLDWRTRDLLGHLRAYTPTDFFDSVARLFPEYSREIFSDRILHARCTLNGGTFTSLPKEPDHV